MLSNEGSAEIYAESLSMAEISQADAKQYDRQIRLWGAQAQQRLSESRVLLIGLSSLGAEVAKNIVLAGIKSLCIFDPTLVAAKDSSNVFLFRPTDHGSRASDVFFVPYPASSCLLYTSPSPRDGLLSRMPSSA